MFLVTQSTPAFFLLSHTIRVKARVVLNQRLETVTLGLTDAELNDLEALVDILEGQYDAVLSVDLLDLDGEPSRRLYKSMLESWDLGVTF